MIQKKKENIEIAAKHIGPIQELTGELSKKDQNLIFALNGTGKSFLARSLYHIDSVNQESGLNVASSLVSEESSDGTGSFELTRGTELIGRLDLNNQKNLATSKPGSHIVHTFTSEFIEKELIDKDYELDGEFKHEIIISSSMSEIETVTTEIENLKTQYNESYTSIESKYEIEKNNVLISQLKLSKSLKEYTLLNLDNLIKTYRDEPNTKVSILSSKADQIKKMEILPDEDFWPKELTEIQPINKLLSEIRGNLKSTTPHFADSVEISQKIKNKEEFIREGINIILNEEPELCPFCEQGITSGPASEVIRKFFIHFGGKVRMHLDKLQEQHQKLQEIKVNLVDIKGIHDEMYQKFNNLKMYLPDFKEQELFNLEDQFNELESFLVYTQNQVAQKALKLDVSVKFEIEKVNSIIRKINSTIKTNNSMVTNLTDSLKTIHDERRKLQREICSLFEGSFAEQNWEGISVLINFKKQIKDTEKKLVHLNNNLPKIKVRDSIAKTFESLLNRFFGEEKYKFDKESFKLKREDKIMQRGPRNTLSEGEKAVVAFCYFIACIHLKVKTSSDYTRLFLIFDDPVSSISYNYMYTVCQVLKDLHINEEGEISYVGGKGFYRPHLLIFTHSSYFFNICATNKVVPNGSTFSLISEGKKHKIEPCTDYLTPFKEQLREVYNVAEGIASPKYTTANSIRSVIEAIGRFCHPDKTETLTELISFLSMKLKIKIESVLIHSFSHGTYFEDSQIPEDIIRASKETIEIVKILAPGQFNELKSNGK